MEEISIAIVGAGFSGTLLALHLMRRCPPNAKILLIERNRQFGRGQAYATGNPSHLLNVPAGRMSAFPDQPDHFLAWLQQNAADETAAAPTGASFVSRSRYGAYVRHLLNEEIKRAKGRLDLLRGDVERIEGIDDHLVLHLGRDRAVKAEIIVLAVGNFPPESPPVADASFYDSPLYRPDPWAADAFTALDATAPVLLIGTGLTMVDAAMSLLDQGHTGPIHALSRRGLLPHRHQAVPAADTPARASYPTSIYALARLLRASADDTSAAGGNWRSTIDELRPFTTDLWQAMSQADRKRFLRHMRPWWDIHRHRMPPAVADRIDAARTSGQLTIGGGRVREYRVAGDLVDVVYRPRFTDRLATIQAARVVNCSGPGCDYDRIAHPLIRSLLRDGRVRPDPLRLGLDVTGTCAMLDRNGCISRRLFAVGPITKGTFWEMNAVPDIRRQCDALAAHLASLPRLAVKTPALA